MFLIVGLGNPGEKYKNTRHNVGFMTIDNLQLTIDKFSDWKNIKKLQAVISKGEINGQKVLLAKPRTFMNFSGQAVKKLVSNVKCQMSNVLVIHDDIDLPLGKIKIVKNRGAGGHKGVESIIKILETKNFIRFRIGVWPKSLITQPTNHKIVEKFVLQKFNKGEEKMVKEVIKKTIEAIEVAIKDRVEKAMDKYNR